MDAVRDYQRWRLALADSLRAALHLARAMHDEKLERETHDLLVRLAGDRFTLAVVGQFSRGKSTLMNAVLGKSFLPTGVSPTTSVITTVTYGSRQRATFRRRTSDVAVEIPLSQVPELVAQASGRRAELQVTAVDIELPAEILRLGFAFVDTPGIGSSIGANSATTRRFMPQTDAVVFVTSFDSAFSQAEVELFRETVNQGIPVFCVVNKRDLVDAEAVGAVMTAVRTVFADAGEQHPRLFALSALGALNAKQTLDADALAASGLPALESALQSFLGTEKSGVFLGNVAERAVDLAARERRDLCIGRGEFGRPELISRAFDTRVDDLVAEQQSVMAGLRARVHSHAGGLFDSAVKAWRRDLAARLQSRIDEFQPQSGDPSLASQPNIGDVFAESADALVREWTAACVAEATELLVGLVAGWLDRLYSAAEAANVIGPAIAGAELPQDAIPRASWTLAELPRLSVPVLELSVHVNTADWLHLRRVSRQSEQRERLLAAVGLAVDDIAAQLRSRFDELSATWLDEIEADATKRSVEAADRFRRHLLAPPPDVDAEALDGLVSTLISLRDEIRRLRSEPKPTPELRESAHPVEAQATEEPPAAERECVVCASMRDALIAFMSQSQYQLATRERDQAEHARTHGFCPAHTWLYGSIASPLGISAGYATVAAAAAEQLSAADNGRASVAELRKAVDALVVPSAHCPACSVLSETEWRAVGAHVGSSDAGRPPVLCAAHTVRVLERHPSLERAGALVDALAANLRRDSEDMRSFALKREAFYRWLITVEESRAYRETLRLLAGDAMLARSDAGQKDLELPESSRYRGLGREEAS